MCWYTKYFEDQAQLLLYKRETKKRFDGLISDLENCEAEAISRLFENLEKTRPSQPSNPKGFLFASFKNVLVDIHRKKFGRPRIPLPMQREGPVIGKIFTLYCLQKETAEQISTLLTVHIDIVRKWTSWLKEKDKCPSRPSFESIDTGGSEGQGLADKLHDVDEPDPTAQQAINEEESGFLGILRGLPPLIESGGDEMDAGQETDVIKRLREQLQLSDEHVILLSMRFVEGMTVSAAAREMNLSRKAFEKQEKMILSQLHQVFKKLGFEP